MCHPLLLALCDRVLLPSCARYQLNLGHLLQRGPGADEQWLHRDELVWSDVPVAAPAAAARVGDRVRRLHPRQRRDARRARAATAGPTAGCRRSNRCRQPVDARPARVRRDAGRLGGRLPRRHDPRRRREHDRRPAPRCAPELLPRAGCVPRRTTTCRSRRRTSRRCRATRRSCSATRCTTASLVAAATSAWSACRIPSSCSRAASSADKNKEMSHEIRRGQRRSGVGDRTRLLAVRIHTDWGYGNQYAQTAVELVHAALKAGVNLIDTAEASTAV